MSQVDWLKEICGTLNEGDGVLSVVSSGDIDAVPIHLFAVTAFWPRKPDGTFHNPVYVLLQKPKPDLYNITQMVLDMEQHFSCQSIGMKVAMVLCMGGNDFLPHFHSISHEKVLLSVLATDGLIQELFDIKIGEETGQPVSGSINTEKYIDLVKSWYCPPSTDATMLSFEEVRQFSVKRPGQKDARHPALWLPPKSALEKVASLIDCQIQYMFTLWDHAAMLPDILGSGCLKKQQSGAIEYCLGNDSHIDSYQELLHMPEEELKKRVKAAKIKVPRKTSCDRTGKKRPPLETPQKGQRRKRRPDVQDTCP